MSTKESKIEAGYTVHSTPSNNEEAKSVATALRAQGLQACVVKESRGHLQSRLSSRSYTSYRFYVLSRPKAVAA